ncbi:hypothetical protein CYMTET_34924, partial [Cymbomonas tetramitiformis]
PGAVSHVEPGAVSYVEPRAVSHVEPRAVGAEIGELAAALRKPLRVLWISQATAIWTNRLAALHELPFTPILLISASTPLQKSGPRRGGATTTGYGWSYLPGAGDDEESWGRGLTPELFWREENHQALLATGTRAQSPRRAPSEGWPPAS